MGTFERLFSLDSEDASIVIKEEPLPSPAHVDLNEDNPMAGGTVGHLQAPSASVPIPSGSNYRCSIGSSPLHHHQHYSRSLDALVNDDYKRFGIEFVDDSNSQMSSIYGTCSSNGTSVQCTPSNTTFLNLQNTDDLRNESPTTCWADGTTNKLMLIGNGPVIADDETSSSPLKQEPSLRMDVDDIFQVDKSDLIQLQYGPTLAELNANEDTLLSDLNFDDLLLPGEDNSQHFTRLGSSSATTALIDGHSYGGAHVPGVHLSTTPLHSIASSCPTHSSLMYYSGSPDTVPNLVDSTTTSPPTQRLSAISVHHSTPNTSPYKYTTLHELLSKRPSNEAHNSMVRTTHHSTLSSSGGGIISIAPSRLSTSAPTHLCLDQLWQRREPRKHLLSTGSLVETVEGGSTSSLSTGGFLSPDPMLDFSQDDENEEEDDDSDEDVGSDGDPNYDDFSTEESDNEHTGRSSVSNKKERYFWQYNVQSKGPKGQRLVMRCKMEDPHVLNEVTDPVFSPDCSVRGIKHSGKARKGDGNDLTPNTRKLFSIGRELDKLSRVINDMTPVSELPFNVRPKSRKEKNKLASRACRLKKKAQHEANKIKLNGLEMEHRNLLTAILQCRDIIKNKLQDQLTPDKQDDLYSQVMTITKAATKFKVAGHTTEYVNRILDRYNKGHVSTTTPSSSTFSSSAPSAQYQSSDITTDEII